jgi:SAM-dependent methyltransferase
MALQPGAWVLDLGCGAAESSLYLAEVYGARVVAADLGRDPEKNAAKIEARGYRDHIHPMRLDARQPLPFPEATFDAILCVNSLNFYGTDLEVIDRLARHLKPGGLFCSGGECLSAEFSPEQLADPPAVYAFGEPVWEEDFLTLHSPGWWARHIGGSRELQLESCQELEDGPVFYEEQALVSQPEGYFGLSAQEARELEIRQIAFGREHGPYMTIHLLVARRR